MRTNIHEKAEKSWHHMVPFKREIYDKDKGELIERGMPLKADIGRNEVGDCSSCGSSSI